MRQRRANFNAVERAKKEAFAGQYGVKTKTGQSSAQRKGLIERAKKLGTKLPVTIELVRSARMKKARELKNKPKSKWVAEADDFQKEQQKRRVQKKAVKKVKLR